MPCCTHVSQTAKHYRYLVSSELKKMNIKIVRSISRIHHMQIFIAYVAVECLIFTAFYPHDAMLAWYMLSLYVRLSDCHKSEKLKKSPFSN